MPAESTSGAKNSLKTCFLLLKICFFSSSLFAISLHLVRVHLVSILFIVLSSIDQFFLYFCSPSFPPKSMMFQSVSMFLGKQSFFSSLDFDLLGFKWG